MQARGIVAATVAIERTRAGDSMGLLRYKVALLCALLAGFGLEGAWAETPEHLEALSKQVVHLHREEKYREAEPIAEHYVDVARQSFGEQHLEYAKAIALLADNRKQQERHIGEAKDLYERVLAIREKLQGADHPDVASALNSLGEFWRYRGDLARAQVLHERSLDIRENSLESGHPAVAQSLHDLGMLYLNRGEYEKAEHLLKRALVIREKALAPDHIDIGDSLAGLAELYRVQGRFAEPLIITRSLEIREKALGPNHPSLGRYLYQLLDFYRDQQRYAEAETLAKRRVELVERGVGAGHPDVAWSIETLADIYQLAGRYDKAETVLRRAVAITESSNAHEIGLAKRLRMLGDACRMQDRFAEAMEFYERALPISEKWMATQGESRTEVADLLAGMGSIRYDEGRFAEAGQLFTRSLQTYERSFGADHPRAAAARSNLALTYFAQEDWQAAARYWQESSRIIIAQADRYDPEDPTFSYQLAYLASGLLRASYRLQPPPPAALLDHIFQVTQWAQVSKVVSALAQMAARTAKNDAILAALIREQQTLREEWKRLVDQDRSVVREGAGNKQSPYMARLTAVDNRLAEIGKALATSFPDYAALAKPGALTIADVQAHIRSNEAVVLYVDMPSWGPMPEESFAWVITKTDWRWMRIELGTSALVRGVTALRCGLDRSAWEADGGSRCAGLLDIAADKMPKENEALPFDIARAHALYKALLGQVEDLIRGKHLLIVPSGPLTQLPIHVLATEGVRPKGGAAYPASAADLRRVPWLARKHAITVLPAVSSLKALRRVARPSSATKPMIGFGTARRRPGWPAVGSRTGQALA